MNITQILLGSTAAMLLVALILSYSSMQDGVEDDRLRHSAKDLMEENARLQAEITRLRSGQVPSAARAPQPVELPDEASKARVRELEAQNALLQQQKEQEEKKRLQAEKETLAMNERQAGKYDKEARRARLIEQAMLMAQVKEVVKNDKGQIQLVVLETRAPQGVRVGAELALRRGTGIIGRLQVSSMDGENVFADPLPGSFPNADGKIDIKVGDELIIPPL